MSEQKQEQNQSGNVFTGTGISIVGVVKNIDEYVKKETGRVYYSVYLVTAYNPELRVSLGGPPDPRRFQQGSKVRMNIGLRYHNGNPFFVEASA